MEELENEQMNILVSLELRTKRWAGDIDGGVINI